MTLFKLQQEMQPAGDQPSAIKALTKGILSGAKKQTLLGVTGSGKTFTVANVIQNIGKPTLVIAHNKTLAAQLCNEFRELFPNNAVHYFVSYYDYYQPEAYIPRTDTYIEKEAMINDEIDRLRHAATTALLTRKDVIIVASVSCIYGLGAPEEYGKNIFRLKKGDALDRTELLNQLVGLQFTRTTADLSRGTFRVNGDTWEIMPTDTETIYLFDLEEGRIARMYAYNPVEGFVPGKTQEAEEFIIPPAKHFITNADDRTSAIELIRGELKDRLKYFEENKLFLEAERLERRTNFDLAMMREVGYCHGIENYSRHLSGRAPGLAPDTLLSYFPKDADGNPDFLTVIDESHITIPQINGMHGGDKSRKQTLVEFGFRLPSAKDNRPLTFAEFEGRVGQTIYVSATPGEYELDESKGNIVEQIIRPTGLIDPKVTIRPARGQVADLVTTIEKRLVERKNERVMVTTLTKKMAEELTDYLLEKKIKVNYLHSDVKTMDRIKILSDFRRGTFDVLVGVNLLREGLDLPEVSLVAILDADKEGFLRSDTSLIQTIGRAARNSEGEVILYADNITGSIKRAMGETDRRREKQVAHNKKYGITPKTIVKEIKDILPAEKALALEIQAVPHEVKSLERMLKDKEREMRESAYALDFELAAILRDEVKIITKELEKMKKKKTK